ncbi:DinB family protein [Halobacillus sp. H74]|uniref:DinB family protein n=1 Tax=Halobacillus sp. H74 TaxID=3457436 RepID=UPI003FCE4EF3
MGVREILLEQLQSVYDENNWFVCFNVAVKELTEAEASGKKEDHPYSIAELVHHLYFYNERYLNRFCGKEVPELPRHYNTFQNHDQISWNRRVSAFQMVMSQFRAEIKTCSDEKLEIWSETLSHLFNHNAYHIGQIVNLRKQSGWWGTNPVVKG